MLILCTLHLQGIEKELIKLQHLIDHANEKGWRREYPLNRMVVNIAKYSIIIVLLFMCYYGCSKGFWAMLKIVIRS